MTTHRYPPAVVEAAETVIAKMRFDTTRYFAEDIAIAALDAAFAAWEGMHKMGNGTPGGNKPLRIILPLPKESDNAS